MPAWRSGLSVIQGDADTDLRDYPDDAFDYVILCQTLQATREPREVLQPDAAHRQAGHRVVPQLRPLAGAAAPGVRRPHARDAVAALQVVRHAQHPSLQHRRLPRLCRDMGVRIERAIVLDRNSRPISLPPLLANLFGEQAVFMLQRD